MKASTLWTGHRTASKNASRALMGGVSFNIPQAFSFGGSLKRPLRYEQRLDSRTRAGRTIGLRIELESLAH